VRGNALNLSREFHGKAFDLIIAVGVLGAGGQSGQSFRDNAIFYSLNSHRIAKSAINALTQNKNALFCATPISALTTLRRRAVERFARVAQWSPLTDENSQRARGAVFLKMPHRADLGYSTPGEYHESVYRQGLWIEKNRRYHDYGEKLISGAPSLVILKRK
jgi:hypothetical protein